MLGAMDVDPRGPVPPAERPPSRRRAKASLYGPLAFLAVFDFLVLIYAGLASNTVTDTSTMNLIWYGWLFVFIVSLVLAGWWLARWRRF